MNPTIDLHGIASLRLTPIQTYEREDGSPFASRDLVATDKHGREFRIGLFADAVLQLSPYVDIRDPEPAETERTKL